MARYIGPVCRLCRREGTKLFLKGERCHTEKYAILDALFDAKFNSQSIVHSELHPEFDPKLDTELNTIFDSKQYAILDPESQQHPFIDAQ